MTFVRGIRVPASTFAVHVAMTTHWIVQRWGVYPGLDEHVRMLVMDWPHSTGLDHLLAAHAVGNPIRLKL